MPDTVAPAAVADSVTARVAAAWDVDPESVRLSWWRGAASLPEDGPVELLGNGAGGAWVVRAGAGRSARSVRVKAGVMVTLPVAARVLERGQVLEPENVRYEKRLQWGPPSRDVPRDVSGFVVNRVVPPGSVLSDPAVSPPPLVEAGQAVQLIWRRGTIELKLSGTAAGTGAKNQRVAVRTPNGQRLEGVVMGPGLVHIDSRRQ